MGSRNPVVPRYQTQYAYSSPVKSDFSELFRVQLELPGAGRRLDAPQDGLRPRLVAGVGVGSARAFFRDPVAYVREQGRGLAPLRFAAWPSRFVLIRDPDTLWRVLVTDATSYEPGKWKRRARRFFGATLNTLAGPAHRERRLLLTPPLDRRRVRGFAPAVPGARLRSTPRGRTEKRSTCGVSWSGFRSSRRVTPCLPRTSSRSWTSSSKGSAWSWRLSPGFFRRYPGQPEGVRSQESSDMRTSSCARRPRRETIFSAC